MRPTPSSSLPWWTGGRSRFAPSCMLRGCVHATIVSCMPVQACQCVQRAAQAMQGGQPQACCQSCSMCMGSFLH